MSAQLAIFGGESVFKEKFPSGPAFQKKRSKKP